MIAEFNRDETLPRRDSLVELARSRVAVRLSERRRLLLSGLRSALRALHGARCQRVYIDGSFVTAKREPGDYDACWDIEGIDLESLDPVFLDFSNARRAQKRKYFGEFFPAQMAEGATGKLFLNFFQTDKETRKPKGIVGLKLQEEEL